MILDPFLVVLFITFYISLVTSDNTWTVPGEEPVVGVVGSSTHLACNMTPPSLTDKVYLVLWFKDGNPLPIYSYDAREFTKKRWSEDKMFGARATFRDTVSPAQLRIDRLERADAGKYTCRVDFRASPTVTRSQVLEVVEQSSKPVVITDQGVEVMGSVGPYLLGQSLILVRCAPENLKTKVSAQVCMAEGEPAPEVIWTRDGTVWDEEMDPGLRQGEGGQRRNTLVVSPLEREHAGNRFRCVAETPHIQHPPHTDIVLDMNLPVLDLRLVSLPSPLRAERRYEVLCQAIGASPAPEITWSLTSSHGLVSNLTSSAPQLSARGNLSTSVLDLYIGLEDHGSVLTCGASVGSGLFPEVNVSRRLTVNHPPQVTLRLEGEVTRLVEGQGLEMRCEARARPPVQEWLWYRNGVIVARGDMFQLSNLTSDDGGEFWCEAINSEGVGQSSRVPIVVVFRPVCHDPEVTRHPAEFSPGVSLTCGVESFPAARSYRWQYNSSQGSFQIPNAKSMMSFMNYAVSEAGGTEGEVLCWATNEVGEQHEPCVFHVVPLGAPQPPSDCEVIEAGDTRVRVICEAGYGGGEDQTFHLALLDLVEGVQTSVASNWSRDPDIELVGLEPQYPRLLSVHAANSHGRSDPIYLTTEMAAATRVGQIEILEREGGRQSVLYIIVSVLSSIMILSLLLSLSHFCRRKRLERLATKIEADKPNIQLISQSAPLLNTTPSSTGDIQTSTPLLNTTGDTKTEDTPKTSKDLLPRKVSFCEQCRTRSSVKPSTGPRNGIQRTVVRSYSIDKLRPRCYTCNPSGDTPYPLHSETTKCLLSKAFPDPIHPSSGDEGDYYDNV